jgi:hypothetical protein
MMPLYDVIFQIDAHGTEIAHRCEAADFNKAYLRASHERDAQGKRGFVVRVEEVEGHKDMAKRIFKGDPISRDEVLEAIGEKPNAQN